MVSYRPQTYSQAFVLTQLYVQRVFHNTVPHFMPVLAYMALFLPIFQGHLGDAAYCIRFYTVDCIVELIALYCTVDL